MLHVLLLLMRLLGLSLCKRGTMVLPQTAGQAFPPQREGVFINNIRWDSSGREKLVNLHYKS